jgi:hypothetical protein
MDAISVPTATDNEAPLADGGRRRGQDQRVDRW